MSAITFLLPIRVDQSPIHQVIAVAGIVLVVAALAEIQASIQTSITGTPMAATVWYLLERRAPLGNKKQGATLDELLHNVYFLQNRPQWLIAPLPVGYNTTQQPSANMQASTSGIVAGVAQRANDIPQFDASVYRPYFSDAQLAAALQYSQRSHLAPIGGPNT